MKYDRIPQPARDRLDETYRREGPHLGPTSEMAKICEDEETVDDKLDPDYTPYPDNAVLTEWVTICAWVDDKGETWTTRITSPRLPSYRIEGLLRAYL